MNNLDNVSETALISELKLKGLWPFPEPNKVKVDEKSFYVFKKETDTEWLKDMEDARF